MKWLIPSKTFLLGEYAALSGDSALVLTTPPVFELSLKATPEISGIHPNAPAAIFWANQKHQQHGLSFHDPFNGRGGLGASSAQFIGAYLAHCALSDSAPSLDELLSYYFHFSWSRQGIRPSGYDIIAQTQNDTVFINRNHSIIKSYSWPFENITFFLVHTGIKLATHNHLSNTTLPQSITLLSDITDSAHKAFQTANEYKFIQSINQFHQLLYKSDLVMESTAKQINQLKAHPNILAIKGCGALGADILLILSLKEEARNVQSLLEDKGYNLILTEPNNPTKATKQLICI